MIQDTNKKNHAEIKAKLHELELTIIKLKGSLEYNQYEIAAYQAYMLFFIFITLLSSQK